MSEVPQSLVSSHSSATMATLILFSGLKATRDSESILISGATFQYKDTIKAIYGAKWDPQGKAWRLPLDADLSSLTPPPPPPPSARELQARADYYISDAYLRRVCGSKNGRCCSEATTKLDDFNPQGPMWYVCKRHGSHKSDYDGT